ncbi:MAG: hypothetical protein ABR529_03785 [Actinomycetota bacterium]
MRAGLERETFEREADRLLAAARTADVMIRLLGALAFRYHCPRYGELQDRLGRVYTDIDFAGYGRDADSIRSFFAANDYNEDGAIYVASEGSRLMFDSGTSNLHIDVFLDKLDFSHTILWRGRLESDYPTIPLAELLLEKMQIVKINEKDLIDTAMILLEHDLGDVDEETVNVDRVAKLCAENWGLYRTVTENLDKVRQYAHNTEVIEPDERDGLDGRIAGALERIEQEPKSMKWKMRSRVGERVKWYQDVDEVGPS